jgi:Tfp pilus assembly protein PilZ
MANQGERSQPRLRVSGVAAHVRSGSVAFSCQVEELSAGGAFLRTDQSFSPGSEVDLDLVKPGARKVLRLGGRISRAVPSGQGQHPGLEIEFSAMSGDVSARLAQWLEEMIARGTGKAVAPIDADPSAGEGGADGPHANAKLMTQIKGLLLEMDDLRDRLRQQEGEIEQLRRDLAVAAAAAMGKGPGP